MAEIPDDVKKLAAWLREMPEEEQERRLKQAKLLAVNDTPADDLLKAPISKLGDYLALDLPTPPEIVKPGIIVRGEIHSLSSRAGKGKTTFTLNRFVRWAANLPMFDDLPDVMAPGVEGGVKTLIIENEGSAGYFQDRMKDIIGHGNYTPDQIKLIHENILVWGDGSYSGVKVDDNSKLAILRRGIKTWKPDIVFLDPFRSIWSGDENDGSQMNDAMDALAELCHDYDCAVFMNHHETKSKEVGDEMDRSRGSTVLEGAAATMEQWKHVKGGTLSEISWTKKRYGKKPAPIRVRFNFDTWTYEHVGESELDRQILGVLGDAPDAYLSVADVHIELDENERKVRDRLNRMCDEKRIHKVREGGGFRYRMKSENGNDEKGGLNF